MKVFEGKPLGGTTGGITGGTTGGTIHKRYYSTVRSEGQRGYFHQGTTKSILRRYLKKLPQGIMSNFMKVLQSIQFIVGTTAYTVRR